LCPLVALLACESRQAPQIENDDLPAEEMIGDVPAWALDVYTREGRAAFARLLETDAPAARWVKRNVRQARRVSFLGHIVFRVEGALSPIGCGGRWPRNFAAKSTSSARVQGARTPRKSSNSCETIYLG
jgi:hypothetical protein